MVVRATGELHGRTITLDSAISKLDGRRVRLVIEPADEADEPLSADLHARLWEEWSSAGPQGPIEVDEGPDFP